METETIHYHSWGPCYAKHDWGYHLEELANPQVLHPTTPEDDSTPYAFTPAEFERLYIYRLAVRAGFFNEGW